MTSIRKRKSSLPKLFAITVIIISAIAAGISMIIYFDVKKDRIKDLHYSVSVLKRYYEAGFEQWGNALILIGEQLSNIKGENQDSVRLEYLKGVDANYEELMAIGYTNTNGDVLTFSRSELGDSLPRLMDSPNSRRSFIKAKESEFMSIGESYYFPNVKDWILPIRVPIKNDSGRLVALNTTAFQYKSLTEDLNSFDFDSSYNLLLVNDDFNVIQYYYPLDPSEYDKIFRKEMNVWTERDSSSIDNINYFSAYNKMDGQKSIVLSEKLTGLNHSLYFSMPQSLIWADMEPYATVIVVIYLLLILLIVVLFRYSMKKEKQYVSSLIESEANLSSIFESTNNLIALFDRNKRIIEFNQAFFEYSKAAENIEVHKGMDILKMLKDKDAVAKFVEWQDRALAGEKFKETTVYTLPEGARYFQFSYNPIYQNGQITGLSMFVDDVTELKTYQSRLEELVNDRTQELVEKNKELEQLLDNLKTTQQRLVASEKMASLGLMAAGIGHEINNPLNFIQNGATALEASLEENEDQNHEYKPFLGIIYDGVKRASNIVSSLSHFSRQVKTMDETCDINAIIENCLRIVHNKIKNRIEIKKDLNKDCPKIIGNEGKLHQAMLNFINNAQQAIVNTGEINIKTNTDNSNLTVTISDTGKGIDKKNIEKIADPFYTTKNPGEGTGLGLFISYNIIEEHNGEIDVKSKLNEGTTFIITFDLTN